MSISAQSLETARLGSRAGVSSSYGQILKSSSLAGGAQAITLLLAMVRTKVVALLLGPSGVGLIGLYESAVGLMGTVTGLGIGQSAVRQVAEAHGSGDTGRVGRTVRALRRVCWFTGLLGTLLTASLAYPFSVWTFGSPERAVPLAVLGVTLLLTAISGGQSALVRGVRRIADLALMQVLSSLAALVISVGLYAWLGEQGIVPVFLVAAALNLGFSWWFARRVEVPAAELDWGATFRAARGFVKLGLAFMLSGLFVTTVGLVTRAWILRDLGIQSNGFFQAAYSISGAFAGFILGAMGMDFYPRLTAAARDNAQVNRLVNEQTEIGILLALPGLLATLVFSPWLIIILYSGSFTSAAALLPWFVIGVFGRVISYPLAFIMLAKGAAGWFAVSETFWSCLHLVLIWIGLRMFGLEGIALAFAILYTGCTMGVLWVARRLSQFRWSPAVRRLLGEAVLIVLATFLLVRFAPALVAALVGGVLVPASGLVCVRRICQRLGKGHRASRLVARIPWLGSRLAGA